MVGAHVERTIGLALAGGAARGLSHIGILDVLDELGIQPSRMAGTSFGAIVAAARGLGWSQQALLDQSRDFRFASLLRPRWPSRGVSSSVALGEHMRWLYGDATFADMSIPVRLAATDFETGEAVIFDSGPVWAAVAASACIPVIFAPFEWEGRLLVDGGLRHLNPTPLLMDCSTVIGTYLGLVRMTTGLPASFRETMMQTIEIFAAAQIESAERLASVMIRPDVLTWDFLDFSDPAELRARGRVAAESQLDLLTSLMEDGQRSSNR